ncbi:toluene tolerance protein [bacterium endosymbiont of Escarpia laminata]|nr:MAG: toluene tolerance protein [bacterium endosymbiont of Escarpia laminata]
MDGVVGVLNDKGLTSTERRDRVSTIVDETFDFQAMSQIILATNWRNASKNQQARFIELFRELLENTYFSALDSYSGQTARLGWERVKGKRAQVQTFVVTSNAEIPVSYKLRQKQDDWFVYDVIVNGVSLVSNYRTSFRNLVKQKGMDGLLEQLQQKVAKLRSKQTPVQ